MAFVWQFEAVIGGCSGPAIFALRPLVRKALPVPHVYSEPGVNKGLSNSLDIVLSHVEPASLRAAGG